MADAAGDEPKDPFDAQTSGRDPFPPFDAALAAATEDEHDSALNWSIDTLAELKPVPISPLVEQKQASALTPQSASGFFEDETQYEVLRTPLHARAATTASKPLLTPSPSHPLELHRRCRETIARCEARVRERQRKMDSLQAVLPPRTPKRSSSGDRQSSPPQRSTPRPAKRNKPSAFTPISERKSSATKPPMWSASPIATVGSRRTMQATPSALQFDGLTPSPLLATPKDVGKQTPHSKQRLSFGLSPIMFSSPAQEHKNDEEEAQDRSLPSTPSMRFETEKENGERDPPQDAVASSSSSSCTPPSSPPKKAAAPTRSKRQQAFMAAIEAEASSSRLHTPSDSKRASSPILALYQEAKRMGVTDPTAQWEYVQLLRRGDGNAKQTR